MSVRARAGRTDMYAPSLAAALEWAGGMARTQRRMDALPWEEVIEAAKSASSDSEYGTLEAWDSADDAYLGDCMKGCHEPTIMVKGSVREFHAFGVYICSGCDYAYPPGCEPDRSDTIGLIDLRDMAGLRIVRNGKGDA
jgi:hypothetical protein